MVKIQMCKNAKKEDIEKYENGNYCAEIKFDGSRIIYDNGKFFTTDRKTYGLSRDVSHKFPELEHKARNVILDGEIVAESGVFEDTGSRIHTEDKLGIKIGSKKNPVIYKIFDILEIKGKDVSNLPVSQRKKLLKELEFDNERLEIVECVDDIRALWEQIKEEKKEGIIIKDMNAVYQQGKRSWNWLKLKYWKEDIVEIQGYTENPKGIRGVIKSNEQGLQIAGNQHIPVKQRLDDKGSVKVEIQYLTKNEENGKYRFPSFKRLLVE